MQHYSNCLGYVRAQLSNKSDTHPHIYTGPQYPSISISRQLGARGTDISQQLLTKLRELYPPKERRRSWTLFDKELVHEFLREQHLPARMEKYLPEDTVNPFGEAIEEILGLHPSSIELFEKMKAMIRRLAEIGKVIIVGRGSNIITRDLPQMVHIRLTAPLDDRIGRVQETESISANSAKKRILKDDQAKNKYVHAHFDRDINDPRLYDVCYDTSMFGDDEIVVGIIEMVRERERVIASES